MYGFDPMVGVGKAKGIKLVRAVGAGVAGPVLPVLHDDIQGNSAPAKLSDDIEALLRGLIALARLPQAKGPERHHRGVAGDLAIAGDDAVDVRAVAEVIVDAVANV